MSGVLSKILEMVKKLGYLAMQYAYVVIYWKLRFIKVQLQKLKKSGAEKKMAKAYSALGAEVYSLYKQGDESDWRSVPSLRQQLTVVEEAESKVFQVDEVIEEINSNYLAKKDEIKEKYSSKRADVGSEESEEV